MPRRRHARLFALGFAAVAGVAVAGEQTLPVARVTIYPGDAINDAMLEDKPTALNTDSLTGILISRDRIVGKVARRTLLPGQPIPSIAIDNPRIIAVGAQVKIVFSEAGMQIVAYGLAQQAGAIGDIIRVRNTDSGLFVSGRVQPDGSIRVSEG